MTIRLPREVRAALLSREDVEIYRDLCSELANNPRDAVGLVGAGVSHGRYPDWDELLDGLRDQIEKHPPESMRDSDVRELRRASHIQDRLVKAGVYERLVGRRRFRKFLASQFQSPARGDDELPRLVARLPFRYVFTTNYDDTLERTYRRMRQGLPARALGLNIVDWSMPSQLTRLVSRWGEPMGRWYVHLHGVASRPQSIVLTEKDYVDRYVRSDSTTRTLLSLLAFRTLVCLGFSLRDADLTQVLRAIKALRGAAPRHYAFLGVAPDEERDARRRRVEYADKFGVKPIYYRVRAGRSHAALLPLVEHLTYYAASEQLARTGDASPALALSRLHASLAEAWRDPLLIDDPNKHAFGGRSEREGRRLTAKIGKRWRGLWNVTMRLESTENAPPLVGPVTFYTHPTFPPSLWRVRGTRLKRSSTVVARLRVWGAFTIGVVVETEALALELDLSTISNAPDELLSR